MDIKIIKIVDYHKKKVTIENTSMIGLIPLVSFTIILSKRIEIFNRYYRGKLASLVYEVESKQF